MVEQLEINELGDLFSGNASNFSSNGTYDSIDFGFAPSWWSQLITNLLYIIVCVVGLCGNTLVIYVVTRFAKLQTVTNFYIVNLAIADDCFLVGIPFLVTTATVGYWPFGKLACKAYFTSTSINQITSSMFLLIMSADRYVAVCHPISAPRWRTPLIAKVVSLTAWTVSAILMVPIFIFANTLEINGKANCNIFWPESALLRGEAIFMLYSFFTGFAVPIILISVFYVLVVLKLRTLGPKRRQQQADQSKSTKSGEEGPLAQQNIRAKDRKRSHRKVTKLVLTVVTVYFLSWLPYWSTQLALISMNQDTNHSGTMLTIFLLAGCLSYSNSAMNPILYAFLSDNFKKSFLKACTCAKRKEVNAALHVENSLFPRNKRGSERGRGRDNPACTSSVPQIRKDHHEDDLESDPEDEGAAILGKSNFTLNDCSALTATSEVSKTTQETFIQDGVHVTSL